MTKKVLTVASLSGGIDSFATAHKALSIGHDIIIIHFIYQQKHVVENISFETIVQYLKERFPDQIKMVYEINLNKLFKDIIDMYVTLRDDMKIKEKTEHEFYFPSRNLLFSVISSVIGEIFALYDNYNEVNIALGIHEHSELAYGKKRNYWDITVDFVEKLNQLLSLNDSIKIEVFAPFKGKRKSDIIKYVINNELPYKITWTCYNPIIEVEENYTIYKSCGKCEACIERKYAFNENGRDDYDTEVKLENIISKTIKEIIKENEA